jgi:hypothetical protein
MSKRIEEEEVRRRAGFVCEYCRLPQATSHLAFPLDHIVSRQHRDESVSDNLALCCPHCNLHKGPNLAGIDRVTGQLTRLFHPRHDRWDEHFRWDGATIVGLTDVGRTTMQVLAMNEPNEVLARQMLMLEGRMQSG